jgi:Raf kinase inhibitor-like YbhB/YbcL family protein
MQLTSTTFADGEAIPQRCAFGIPDPLMHMRLGTNRNPQLAWAGLPDGTRSLVITCIDPDVPSSPEGINEEGRTVPEELPRVDFTHWVMVDVPATVDGIDEGSCSSGVIAGGKQGPDGPPGARQGINDYTSFLAGDRDMRGDYYGYDGPCPPWNDERLHHYRFTVYATDLERCPVDGRFTAADVLAAIAGHVLAEASLTGSYTLNPRLLPAGD